MFASLHAGIHIPRQTPPGRHPPPPSDTTEYGQQAGGTHPTGMHTCFSREFEKNSTKTLSIDTVETVPYLIPILRSIQIEEDRHLVSVKISMNSKLTSQKKPYHSTQRKIFPRMCC